MIRCACAIFLNDISLDEAQSRIIPVIEKLRAADVTRNIRYKISNDDGYLIVIRADYPNRKHKSRQLLTSFENEVSTAWNSPGIPARLKTP